MLNRIFRNWKLNKDEILTLLLALPIACLIGVGMNPLIMMLDEEINTYFCMGTILCLLVVIIFTVVTGYTYHQEFMLALSMGQTRKAFMAICAVRKLVFLAISYVVILLLYRLELAAYSVIFPLLENEFAFDFLTDWRIILPAIPSLLIVSMFIGSIYSRFGKTGGMVMYFAFLAACLGLPRLLHEGSPVLAFVLAIPTSAWIAAAIAVAAAMLIFVLFQGRKQMVR